MIHHFNQLHGAKTVDSTLLSMDLG